MLSGITGLVSPRLVSPTPINPAIRRWCRIMTTPVF